MPSSRAEPGPVPKTLKEQAGGPSPTQRNGLQPRAGGGCAAPIPQYVNEFKKVYGEPAIDIGKVTTAIAAFEDTLVTPDSRFDQWLKGNKKALSAQSCAATKLSRTAVVVACHNGPNVGGNSFSRKWARSSRTKPATRPRGA